jgi:acyl-CoA thioesterase I
MGLATSMATVAAIQFFWTRNSDGVTGGDRRIALVSIGILWALWSAAMWESYAGTHSAVADRLDPSRPIVCLGDSLTTGLSDDEAYPLYLRQLVSVPVLNFGRAGITARDALKRLPAALAMHPQVVVVELGGHDFLRGYGRESARASLVEIIAACRAAGAAVILVEIPRGFITDSFSGLERELARKYDLTLIPDTAIRMLVVRSPVIPVVGGLTEPHLSDDGLHPNVAGAHYLAESVYRSLLRMCGSEIAGDSERPVGHAAN